MAKKYTAQCACGAVKFEFDTDPDFIANCHCLDCKRASGGEMATFFGVPQDDFTVVSGKPKAHHYVAESGKGLDRNFCPDCGSRLFRPIWRVSPASSSSCSAAWTGPN